MDFLSSSDTQLDVGGSPTTWRSWPRDAAAAVGAAVGGDTGGDLSAPAGGGSAAAPCADATAGAACKGMGMAKRTKCKLQPCKSQLKLSLEHNKEHQPVAVLLVFFVVFKRQTEISLTYQTDRDISLICQTDIYVHLQKNVGHDKVLSSLMTLQILRVFYDSANLQCHMATHIHKAFYFTIFSHK